MRRALLLPAFALALAAFGQDAAQRRGFSIKITAPAADEFVAGRTTITAEVKAERPADVERVEFLVNDKVVFVDREAPYACVYDFGEESRAWVIRAVAHHTEGFTVSSVVVTRKITISAFEEVNRVLLWVTVTDRNDRLVSDLKGEDFTVFEDGVQQEIKEFTLEERPITMAIVLDSSGSMREQLDDVHQAAASFVETLRPVDHAMVIDFDDKVFLLQDLTSDQAELKTAVTSTEALGSTALYDALHAAFRRFRGIEGRKALVLLSDGEDSSSQFGYDRVIEEAKAGNVLIYSIGLGAQIRRSVLKEFSDTTGGRAYFVDKASELKETYQRIAEELRLQYYVAYATNNKSWNGRFIKLEVKGRNPDWTVRARKGYFAVKGGGPAPAAVSPPPAR